MNKNLKLKKTLFVMFIISVALLVCFAAAYFFQPVHAAGQIEAGVENLKVNWQLISESFVFPFDANFIPMLPPHYSKKYRGLPASAGLLRRNFSLIIPQKHIVPRHAPWHG